MPAGRRRAAQLTGIVVLGGLLVACGSGNHSHAGSTTSSTSRTSSSSGQGTLVYVVRHGTGDAIGEMNPDGTGAHLLPIGNPVCCYSPALSPDGTQLVVAGEGTVLVSASDGTGQKVVYASPYDSVSSPVWSPDGTLIAFGATNQSNAPGAPESQLFVMAPDGSGLRQVTQGVNIRDIAWAPDGKSLAFLQNQAEIWTVPLAGGEITQLYGPAQGEPGDALETGLSWAPGPALLFDMGPPLAAFSYQPGEPTAASLLTGATSPSWAPDANRFAAVVAGQVVIAPATGGQSTAVGPIGIQSVRWGPTAQITQLAGGPLHAVGFDVTAATVIPLSETTASVSDSDHTASANQLSASIDWGDGSPASPGEVNIDNDNTARCPCGISGTHTYLH